MSQADIDREFPNLSRSAYEKKSDEDNTYNCFAWAVDDGRTDNWWSPAQINGYYWPQNVPRGVLVEHFVHLYRSECGYEPCDNGEFEEGFEKLAIYVDSQNEVSHVARQKDRHNWTSKLGVLEDIDHINPFVLEPDYGPIRQFLKRPVKNA
ncbi:MAG TPA: hypothetical protein VFQ43_13185 [Nitrososphaera sp.]|nr:hypothetical protein [Nitrososphaera sp.]